MNKIKNPWKNVYSESSPMLTSNGSSEKEYCYAILFNKPAEHALVFK